MSTVNEYNGIPMEQTTETNYNYNVGGEVKKTVPFTKELREWLLMFKSRGIRFADTIDELRLFTKHENKQMFAVIENGSIYQYQLVTTPDDGENSIKPENVYTYNTGRWIKVLSFSDEIVSLWTQMQYTGVWGTNPIPESTADTTFYIDNNGGMDNATTTGTMAHPFKTIAYAINRFGLTNHYWKGKLTLNLLADYTETISILNYFNSDLVINAGIYNISVIEMYGNGNITLSGGGEIGVLKSMLNQNVLVSFFNFNTGSSISFDNDYNVTIESCFVKERVTIHDCKGTVGLANLTIYPTFYVDLLRCKAHVSAIDGDIQANYCFITRTLSPYIYGSHNVISDMDAFFIPTDRTVTINADITADDPTNRIFKTYAGAVTWINDNGSLSPSNRWLIKANTLTSITLYDNIAVHAVSVETVINGRDDANTTALFDDIKRISTYNINGKNSFFYGNYIGIFSGIGTFYGFLSNIGTVTTANNRNFSLSVCQISFIQSIHTQTIALYNCQIEGTTTLSLGTIRPYNCQFFGTITQTGGLIETRSCQGNITQSAGTLRTFNHQGTITRTGGTWVNEGANINAEGFAGNLDNTVTDTQKLAEAVNKLKFGNHADSPTDDIKGLSRYTETANSSKFEMIMKTGVGTYEWVTIKENTW